MSLAMMLSALVRCRVSATKGRRISSVPGISHLPVEIAEADVPEPDVIDHMGFDIAANAGGDGPVHQLAIAGLQEFVGTEFRELAAFAAREDREHVLVELLVHMAVERRAWIMRHAAGRED